MLKIEVIKFEAQDVITASTAAPTEAPTVPEEVVLPSCTNPNGHSGQVTIIDGVMHFLCEYCGAEVDSSGSIIGG